MPNLINFNQYVGLPWQYKGRNEEGVDCWGLIHRFYKEQYGIELPLFENCCYQGDISEIKDGAKDIVDTEIHSNFVKVEQPQTGDIVLLYFRGELVHVGIMVDKRHFLHATVQIGTHIVHYSKWRNKIEGYYRHKSNLVG